MSSQQLRNLWIAILENDEKYLDEYPLIHLMKNQNEVSAAPRIFDVSIRIISILWSTKNTNVQILLCTLVQIMVQSDRILQLLQGKGCLEAVKKILQQSTDSQSLICSGKLLFLLLSTGPMINTFINIGGIEALDRIVDGQIITGQTQEIIEINRWNINLIMTLCLKIISEQACGLVASSSLLAKLVNISRIALDKEESRLQKDSKYNSDNKEQNIEQEVIKEENPDEQIILPVRLEIVRSTLNILCSISLYTNYRSLLITSGLLKLFHTTSSSSSQTLTQSSLLLKKNAIISITSLCEILSILLLRISQSSDSLPALTHPECVAFIVAIADVYIPNISQDDLSERILLVLTFLAEDDNTAEKLSKCKFLPSLIKRILTIILPQDEKQRSKGNKDKFGQQSSIPNLGMKLFSLLATTPDRSLHLIDYEISNLCGNILNVWNKQQIEGKDSSSESDINNVSYQIHADLLQRTVTLLCLLSIGTNPLSAQYDKLRFALTEKNLIYFVSKLLEHNFVFPPQQSSNISGSNKIIDKIAYHCNPTIVSQIHIKSAIFLHQMAIQQENRIMFIRTFKDHEITKNSNQQTLQTPLRILINYLFNPPSCTNQFPSNSSYYLNCIPQNIILSTIYILLSGIKTPQSSQAENPGKLPQLFKDGSHENKESDKLELELMFEKQIQQLLYIDLKLITSDLPNPNLKQDGSMKLLTYKKKQNLISIRIAAHNVAQFSQIINTSGQNAQNEHDQYSGSNSQLQSLRSNSQLQSSGSKSQLQSSGSKSQLQSSGSKSQLQSSESKSSLQSSGSKSSLQQKEQNEISQIEIQKMIINVASSRNLASDLLLLLKINAQEIINNSTSKQSKQKEKLFDKIQSDNKNSLNNANPISSQHVFSFISLLIRQSENFAVLCVQENILHVCKIVASQIVTCIMEKENNQIGNELLFLRGVIEILYSLLIHSRIIRDLHRFPQQRNEDSFDLDSKEIPQQLSSLFSLLFDIQSKLFIKVKSYIYANFVEIDDENDNQEQQEKNNDQNQLLTIIIYLMKSIVLLLDDVIDNNPNAYNSFFNYGNEHDDQLQSKIEEVPEEDTNTTRCTIQSVRKVVGTNSTWISSLLTIVEDEVILIQQKQEENNDQTNQNDQINYTHILLNRAFYELFRILSFVAYALPPPTQASYVTFEQMCEFGLLEDGNGYKNGTLSTSRGSLNFGTSRISRRRKNKRQTNQDLDLFEEDDYDEKEINNTDEEEDEDINDLEDLVDEEEGNNTLVTFSSGIPQIEGKLSLIPPFLRSIYIRTINKEQKISEIERKEIDEVLIQALFFISCIAHHEQSRTQLLSSQDDNQDQNIYNQGKNKRKYNKANQFKDEDDDDDELSESNNENSDDERQEGNEDEEKEQQFVDATNGQSEGSWASVWAEKKKLTLVTYVGQNQKDIDDQDKYESIKNKYTPVFSHLVGAILRDCYQDDMRKRLIKATIFALMNLLIDDAFQVNLLNNFDAEISNTENQISKLQNKKVKIEQENQINPIICNLSLSQTLGNLLIRVSGEDNMLAANLCTVISNFGNSPSILAHFNSYSVQTLTPQETIIQCSICGQIGHQSSICINNAVKPKTIKSIREKELQTKEEEYKQLIENLEKQQTIAEGITKILADIRSSERTLNRAAHAIQIIAQNVSLNIALHTATAPSVILNLLENKEKISAELAHNLVLALYALALPISSLTPSLSVGIDKYENDYENENNDEIWRRNPHLSYAQLRVLIFGPRQMETLSDEDQENEKVFDQKEIQESDYMLLNERNKYKLYKDEALVTAIGFVMTKWKRVRKEIVMLCSELLSNISLDRIHLENASKLCLLQIGGTLSQDMVKDAKSVADGSGNFNKGTLPHLTRRAFQQSPVQPQTSPQQKSNPKSKWNIVSQQVVTPQTPDSIWMNIIKSPGIMEKFLLRRQMNRQALFARITAFISNLSTISNMHEQLLGNQIIESLIEYLNLYSNMEQKTSTESLWTDICHPEIQYRDAVQLLQDNRSSNTEMIQETSNTIKSDQHSLKRTQNIITPRFWLTIERAKHSVLQQVVQDIIADTAPQNITSLYTFEIPQISTELRPGTAPQTPKCFATSPPFAIDGVLTLRNVLLSLSNASLTQRVGQKMLIYLQVPSILSKFTRFALKFCPSLLRYAAILAKNLIVQDPKKDVENMISSGLIQSMVEGLKVLLPPESDNISNKIQNTTNLKGQHQRGALVGIEKEEGMPIISNEERRKMRGWPEWYVRDDEAIFRVIAFLAHTTPAKSGKRALFESGAVDIVLRVAREFFDYNEEIISRFVVIIANLNMDDSINQQLINMHPKPPKYKDNGELSEDWLKNNDENYANFVDISKEEEDKREWALIPTMMRLLERYKNARQVVSSMIAVFTSLALNDRSRTFLSDFGAVEVIVKVSMDVCFINPDVLVRVPKCLNNLSINQSCCLSITKSNGLLLINQLLQRYKDEDFVVVANITGTVTNMAHLEDINAAIATTDLPETIVDCLHTLLMQSIADYDSGEKDEDELKGKLQQHSETLEKISKAFVNLTLELHNIKKMVEQGLFDDIELILRSYLAQNYSNFSQDLPESAQKSMTGIFEGKQAVQFTLTPQTIKNCCTSTSYIVQNEDFGDILSNTDLIPLHVVLLDISAHAIEKLILEEEDLHESEEERNQDSEDEEDRGLQQILEERDVAIALCNDALTTLIFYTNILKKKKLAPGSEKKLFQHNLARVSLKLMEDLSEWEQKALEKVSPKDLQIMHNIIQLTCQAEQFERAGNAEEASKTQQKISEEKINLAAIEQQLLSCSLLISRIIALLNTSLSDQSTINRLISVSQTEKDWNLDLLVDFLNQLKKGQGAECQILSEGNAVNTKLSELKEQASSIIDIISKLVTNVGSDATKI